jgi:hypothetical protein
MTAAVYDFKAINKATLAFPEDRPQNVVEKPAEPESPALISPDQEYHLIVSSDDLQSVDYGMFAGFGSGSVGGNIPVTLARGEVFTITNHCAFTPLRRSGDTKRLRIGTPAKAT